MKSMKRALALFLSLALILSLLLVPAGAAELTALTVTLNPQGGGVQPPAEEVLFTVYTQEGENGAKKLAKAFTLSEIKGNLQTGVFPYLFYRNGGWTAIR